MNPKYSARLISFKWQNQQQISFCKIFIAFVLFSLQSQRTRYNQQDYRSAGTKFDILLSKYSIKITMKKDLEKPPPPTSHLSEISFFFDSPPSLMIVPLPSVGGGMDIFLELHNVENVLPVNRRIFVCLVNICLSLCDGPNRVKCLNVERALQFQLSLKIWAQYTKWFLRNSPLKARNFTKNISLIFLHPAISQFLIADIFFAVACKKLKIAQIGQVNQI